MAFISRVAGGPASAGVLALQTARFHLRRGRAAGAGCPFRVNVRVGRRVVPVRLRAGAGDLFVFFEVLKDECYFVPEALCPAEGVRTVVDCGANVGLASLYFAGRYPEARVFAIEPHPDNFDLLRRNVASQPRIVPVRACVCAEEGRSVFIGTDRPAWGNRINYDGSGARTRGLSLNSLCREHGLTTIDLLKIDIEGAERELFSSPGFLDRTRFVIIELHDDYDLESFRRDAEPFGLTVRGPSPALGTRLITAGRTSP
jgi:FkbM family methyltransferase